MSTLYKIVIGFANGDLHFIQVMEDQDPFAMAMAEIGEIGQLTNAGFRTLVAVVGLREEGQTAVIDYAAVWNGERVDVIVQSGMRMASSYELYAYCMTEDNIEMDSARMQAFCRELRVD